MSPMREGICSTSGMKNSHWLQDRAVSRGQYQELGSWKFGSSKQLRSRAASLSAPKTHVLSQQRGAWFKAEEKIFCAQPATVNGCNATLITRRILWLAPANGGANRTRAGNSLAAGSGPLALACADAAGACAGRAG